MEEVRLDKFKSRTYTARLITKGSSKMMDYGESYQMLFEFTIEWKETPKVELKIVNWVATYEAEYQTINVKNIYELNKLMKDTKKAYTTKVRAIRQKKGDMSSPIFSWTD